MTTFTKAGFGKDGTFAAVRGYLTKTILGHDVALRNGFDDSNDTGVIVSQGYFTTDASYTKLNNGYVFVGFQLDSAASQKARIVFFGDRGGTLGPSTTVLAASNEFTFTNANTINNGGWVGPVTWPVNTTLPASTRVWVALWFGAFVTEKISLSNDASVTPGNQWFQTGVTYASTGNPSLSSWVDNTTSNAYAIYCTMALSGAAPYTKSGYGVAGGVGAGPSASTTAETGTGTSGGVGAGADADQPSETGVGKTGAFGSGSKQTIGKIKSGYATSGGVGAGPSASVTAKTGSGKAGSFGGGVDVSQAVTTYGAGTYGSGTYASGGAITKSGYAVAGGLGSGARFGIASYGTGNYGTGTYAAGGPIVKSGFASTAAVAYGNSASATAETGRGLAGGVGSGARAAPAGVARTRTVADTVNVLHTAPTFAKGAKPGPQPTLAWPSVSLECAFGIDPGAYSGAYMPIAKSLVSCQYLRLTEPAGAFADSSRRNHPGTANGTITRGQASPIADATASAVRLAGGYITASVAEASTAAALTVIAWVQTNGSQPQYTRIFDAGDTRWGLVYNSGFVGIDSYNSDLFGCVKPTDNAWHLIALVIYPNQVINARINIDGVEQGVSQRIGTPTFVNIVLPTNVWWGASATGGGLLDGWLAEPMIVPYAVSPEKLAALYDARTAAAAPATDPNGWTWTSLTPRLREGSTTRGRNTELDRVETGVGTFVVDNNDRALEPEYNGSPYYPNVVPMRPVRLRATFAGVTNPVYFGFVRQWPLDRPSYRRSQISVSCVDAGEALFQDEIATAHPQSLSGTRIDELLDAAGFPLDQRQIAVGSATLAAVDYSESPISPIDALNKAALSEGGLFFFDRQGRAVFQDRYTRTAPPYTIPQATFGDGQGELPYLTIEPDYGIDQVRNVIIVNIPGMNGAGTVTKADYTSVRRFRRRVYTIDTDLDSLTAADSRAIVELERYKNPALRFRSMVVQPRRDPTNLFPQILQRELSEQVTLVSRPPGGGAGITKGSYIEAVQQRFAVGDREKVWETVWSLSPSSTQQYWLLGTSQLDVDARLGF